MKSFKARGKIYTYNHTPDVLARHAKIYKLINENSGITAADIKERTDYSVYQIKTSLSFLDRKGFIDAETDVLFIRFKISDRWEKIR